MNRLEDYISAQKENQSCAVWASGKELSYREFYREMISLSEVILSVGSSQNVALFLPKSAGYLVGYFAVLNAKKTVVPLDIAVKKEELRSTLHYCDVNLILTDPKGYALLKDAIAISDFHVLVMDGEEKWIVKAKNITAEKPYDTEVAMLLHTSGTTGNPKRVMLTHQNLIASAKQVNLSTGCSAADNTLIVLPLFLATGLSQMISHLIAGSSLYLFEELFLPNRVAAAIEQNKITTISVVPFMLKAILDFDIPASQLSSLRAIMCGAGILPGELAKIFVERYPKIKLFNVFGQTEAGPRIAHLTPSDIIRKAGSIGKPLEGIEIRVKDGERDCANFERGELLVRGKNVMKGYYKNPSATEAAVKDGWLHTGDIVYRDDEGYLFLCGRKKNIIICGGVNIYPEMIEEVLVKFPGISDAVVYGEENGETGDEYPYAKIVLDREIDKKELMKFLREYLKPYQIPREFISVEKIEKTKTGKIIRN